MKKDIHPTYYPDAKVTCACGASFTVGSTAESTHVEVCSKCHPFFTGKEKMLDTAGRVDKFKIRMDAAKKFKEVKKSKGEEIKKEEKKKPVKKLVLKDNAK